MDTPLLVGTTKSYNSPHDSHSYPFYKAPPFNIIQIYTTNKVAKWTNTESHAAAILNSM